MENIGIGAGLGAMAFWMFIAAVAVAGIWDGIRKRESQHETIRRVIESGQNLDQGTMDKLLTLGNGSGSGRMDRDFKVTALWILPISPGMVIMGYLIGIQAPNAFLPLMGVAGLLLCLGVGFWIAGTIVSRWYTEG